MMKAQFLPKLLAAAIIMAGTAFSPIASHAESTWEQIQRTGVLRTGVLDAPPYWWRDRGEWKGAMVEMSKDIADTLGVKLELVEVGGWGQVVLNLTGNKIDMNFSLQATPKRATAIDFAGPAYYVSYITLNKKGFNGKTWADYNKPSVKVAVELGSSNETILRKEAPKATVQGFTQLAEGLMSVTSDRSDAFVTTTMTGLIQKNANPGLGDFVIPTPAVQVPGYIGVRTDVGDARFRNFLNWWSEWNVMLGYNEKRLKDALKERGVSEIPDSVHF